MNSIANASVFIVVFVIGAVIGALVWALVVEARWEPTTTPILPGLSEDPARPRS